MTGKEHRKIVVRSFPSRMSSVFSDVKEKPDRRVDPAPREDDARYDATLRPRSLDEYIGQEKHKDNLRVFVEAARRRKEPLDHALFCGPPGLGKTTLAYILANELGVAIHTTSGPALEHKGALAGLVTRDSMIGVAKVAATAAGAKS